MSPIVSPSSLPPSCSFSNLTPPRRCPHLLAEVMSLFGASLPSGAILVGRCSPGCSLICSLGAMVFEKGTVGWAAEDVWRVGAEYSGVVWVTVYVLAEIPADELTVLDVGCVEDVMLLFQQHGAPTVRSSNIMPHVRDHLFQSGGMDKD